MTDIPSVPPAVPATPPGQHMPLMPKSWAWLGMKDGTPSKTSWMLSMAFGVMLNLWAFQSLFVGVEIGPWDIPVLQIHLGVWKVPPFDSVSALTVFGTISALYFGNHNVKVGGKSAAPSAPGGEG